MKVFMSLLLAIAIAGGCREKPKLKWTEKKNTSLQQYYSAGVPDVTKKWSGKDYSKAANTIIKGYRAGSLNLPKKDKAVNAAALFDKIAGTLSYDLYELDFIDLDDQFEFIGSLLKASSLLHKTYGSVTTKENEKLKYSSETTTLTATLFCLANHQFRLLKTKIGRQPLKNEVPHEGLKKAKQGINIMFTGLLFMIEQQFQDFKQADVISMAKILVTCQKELCSVLDKPEVKKLSKRLNILRKHTP
jgi:hypothetical protein